MNEMVLRLLVPRPSGNRWLQKAYRRIWQQESSASLNSSYYFSSSMNRHLHYYKTFFKSWLLFLLRACSKKHVHDQKERKAD